MRRWLSALLAGALLWAVTANAAADDAEVLHAGDRQARLDGQLQGASGFGPFWIVHAPPKDEICVHEGCRDHELRIAVPKGRTADLDWEVRGDNTAFGVDMRLLDSTGNDLLQATSGYIGLDESGRYGVVRRIRSGTYTVRVSAMAGAGRYTAWFELDLR